MSKLSRAVIPASLLLIALFLLFSPAGKRHTDNDFTLPLGGSIDLSRGEDASGSWSSSQPLVASVSAAGTLTALSPGNSTVICDSPGCWSVWHVTVTGSPLADPSSGSTPDEP